MLYKLKKQYNNSINRCNMDRIKVNKGVESEKNNGRKLAKR